MNGHVRKNAELIFVLAIVAVGAILRFYHLGATSLSNDELSALYRSYFENLYDLIKYGVAVDGHPAGVQVFLYYWTRIAGISEFALRFPFAVMGMLSIALSYLVARQWFGTWTGLATASGMAFLQFPLLYSQLERPYASGLFFTLAAVFFWNRILFEKRNRWWNYFGFILFTSLCMYNHYFSFLFVTVVSICGLFFLSKENRRAYVVSGLIIVLLFLPHIPITLIHLNQSGVDWLAPPGRDFLQKFIYYIFNESDWVYYYFWIMVAAAAWRNRKELNWSKYHTLALIFFIMPFLVGYLKSIYSKPVLQYSTLIFSFPYLLIFGFSFLEPLSKRLKYLVILAFSIICLSSTLYEKNYFNTFHYGVFKELAAAAIEWVDQFGSENIEKTINVNNPYYLHYYLDRYDRDISFSVYDCTSPEGFKMLNDVLKESNRPYFIHGGWEDRLGHELILERYPVIIDSRDYIYHTITLYAREDTSNYLYRSFFDLEGADATGWWRNWEDRTTAFAHSGSFSAALKGEHPYGPTFQVALKDLHIQGGFHIIASSWIYAGEKTNYATSVITLDKPDSRNYLWHGESINTYVRNANHWTRVFMEVVLPDSVSEEDVLKYYIWNPGGAFVFVDDMQVGIKK